MGRAKDVNKPNSVFAGSVNSTTNLENSSRLSESTENLRNSLLSRNLYTEFDQYPVQPTDRQRIVNSISSVLDTVAPFNSKSLDNTVFGRLITSPSTPLTDIGLIMLGKQFTLNFKSNVAQEVFPVVNVNNLFDGNPETKLFSENRNFRITNREDASTFENFTEKFFGNYGTVEYPFSRNTTNDEILNNTGDVQLTFLFDSLNKNLYKTNNNTYSQLADEIKVPILDRNYNKTFFGSLINSSENPYFAADRFVDPLNVVEVSIKMNKTYNDIAKTTDFGQEYVPNIAALDDLGTTKINENDINSSDYNSDGFDDNIDNQIIWGRDGINEKVNNRLSILRGLDEDNIAENDQVSDKFNVKFGLLDYTKNLLNASKGKFVDQTKKYTFFKNGTNNLNGSGLWQAPENSPLNGAIGVRQHSILDQYDRFVKTIRFDGNQLYNGNENSVINKSVIPRIHPTIDEDNGVDNKNLMFSLENLAVNVIESNDSKYAIIDDEFGSLIPKSEAGPLGGRLMWFPPYIESFNEVATAKYDPTVMVGRSEPIYTYMHSERAATLTFKLIMDYPPNIKNLKNHKEIVEFFSFAGENYNEFEGEDGIDKKIKDIEDEIEAIEGRTNKKTPNIKEPQKISFYFPNDYPNDNSYSAIDALYNEKKYEIIQGLDNDADTKNFGLNGSNVFRLIGVKRVEAGVFELDVPSGFLQSQTEYKRGGRLLDDNIYDVFNDDNNANFFKIVVTGKATKLYTPSIKNDSDKGEEYNKELGQKRADAVKSFIQQRIKKVLGKSADTLGITIETISVGDKEASEETLKKESIPTEIAKSARVADITFEKINKSEDKKETNLTPEQEKAIEDLKKDLASLETKKSKNKRYDTVNNGVMNERQKEDGAILKGGQSITKNMFYPAFHSQTPEDFHRRLTFLHQCTRQGSAIRSNPEVGENNIKRVKNSVFGRQPICVLRVGDFFNTKVIIESVTIDYAENVWDTNPEGFGLQPMIADITLQMKVLGGQSLKGPIDALQNAVSFNYYANSTFSNRGIYNTPSAVADKQESYIDGVVTQKQKEGKEEFNKKIKNGIENNIYGYTNDDTLE